jgi:hypothetical protein
MKPLVLNMAKDYATQLKKQKEYNQEMILWLQNGFWITFGYLEK